jgi:predicted transcriptional regulator
MVLLHVADMKEERAGDSISSLFMELASETRFSLLLSLSKRPGRLSSLSRELDTSAQDVFRNLNRMAEEGLVRKSDGEFSITEYGLMVVNQVPYFSFLRKHRKFFEGHSLASSGIPNTFLLRIGEIADCSVISSVTEVFQKLKKLESCANSTVKAMVPQAWPEEGEIFIDRASHGVQVQAIVGHNTIVPRDVVETVGDTLEKLTRAGFFATRMIEKVGVGIYICDDSQAGLMFPRVDGEVDMTTLFYSKDSKFCAWCADLFSHYWQGAKRFDLKKTRVVE